MSDTSSMDEAFPPPEQEKTPAAIPVPAEDPGVEDNVEDAEGGRPATDLLDETSDDDDLDLDADEPSEQEKAPVKVEEKPPVVEGEEGKPTEAEKAPVETPKEEPAAAEGVKPDPAVPAPEEKKPEADAAPKVEPEAKPEPAEQPQPEVPQVSQEEYNEYFSKVRDVAINELATKHFNWIASDEATVEKLHDAPEEVLPQLAAQLYFDTVTQTLEAVRQQIPAFVGNYLANQKSGEAANEQFYTAWPKLREADSAALERMASTYRQNNPKASAEQFIQEVGAAAHVALRIPIEAEPAPAPEPEEEKKALPFVPAAKGGQGAPATSPSTNQWTRLDEESFGEGVDDLDLDRR